MSVVEKGHSTNAGAFAAYVFLGNGKKYKKNLKEHTVRPGPAYCDLPRIRDFVELANRCSKKIGSKEKLLTFVMSFKPDELKHNVSNAAACLQMSVELAKKLFPNSAILAKVHADSNALHCHVGTINYDFSTGHSIRKNKDLYYWRYLGDQIVKKHGLSVVKPYAKEKSQYTLNTEKNIKKHGMSWVKKHDFDFIMQQSISKAAAISQNFKQFADHLDDMGIHVKYRIGGVDKTVPDPADEKKKIKKMVPVPGLFFYMSDKDTDQQRRGRNPRIRRRKASKLSRKFIYEQLVKQFAHNQLEAQRQAEQRLEAKKAKQRKQKRLAKQKQERLEKAKKEAIALDTVVIVFSNDFPRQFEKSKTFKDFMKRHNWTTSYLKYTKIKGMNGPLAMTLFDDEMEDHERVFVKDLKKTFGKGNKVYADPETGELTPVLSPAKIKASEKASEKASKLAKSKSIAASQQKSQPEQTSQSEKIAQPSAAKTQPTQASQKTQVSVQKTEPALQVEKTSNAVKPEPTQPSQPVSASEAAKKPAKPQVVPAAKRTQPPLPAFTGYLPGETDEQRDARLSHGDEQPTQPDNNEPGPNNKV